jgi:hypothetical protein
MKSRIWKHKTFRLLKENDLYILKIADETEHMGYQDLLKFHRALSRLLGKPERPIDTKFTPGMDEIEDQADSLVSEDGES